MRKLILLILSISLTGVIIGCSLFVEEIDYQKFAKDLNQKNMTSILHAVEGYSEISHDERFIISSPAGKGTVKKEKNELYFEGVYNTKNDTAIGKGEKSFETSIEKGQEIEQTKTKKSPEFNVSYSDHEYRIQNKNEAFDLKFIFDKLQGIEKIKPKDYTMDLVQPPSIFYDLNEQEFNKIINDDLKIQYDKLTLATILIDLRAEDGKLYATEINVSVEWEKTDGLGKVLKYSLYDRLYFENDNQKARESYQKLRAGGN